MGEEDVPVTRAFRPSVDSRRRQVFEGANKDVLTEIGYTREKIRQFDRHRDIELEPSFWSLEDFFVEIFHSDDPAKVKITVEKNESLIKEQKGLLSSVSKMMHYVNSLKATFEPSLEVLPDLIVIPEDEPNQIQVLAGSIQFLMKRLAEMMTRNTELQWKLAALDEKIFKIQHGMKEIEEESKQRNVAAHLEAVEMQNSMLNELLSKILGETKQVQSNLKELDSHDERVLKRHIREATALNFEILDDAFPSIENKSCCSPSLWLWMPHDLEGVSFDDFVKTLVYSDPLEDTIAAGSLRKLKRDAKEIVATQKNIDRIRQKFKNARQMKMQGEYGSMQYSLELPVSSLMGFDSDNLTSTSMRTILDAGTASQIVSLRSSRPKNLLQVSFLTNEADSEPIRKSSKQKKTTKESSNLQPPSLVSPNRKEPQVSDPKLGSEAMKSTSADRIDSTRLVHSSDHNHRGPGNGSKPAVESSSQPTSSGVDSNIRQPSTKKATSTPEPENLEQ